MGHNLTGYPWFPSQYGQGYTIVLGNVQTDLSACKKCGYSEHPVIWNATIKGCERGDDWMEITAEQLYTFRETDDG